MEKGKLLRRILNVLLTVTVMAFILSASIAVPITFRGLYYVQVEPLKIPESTGYSFETIRDAFEEMMDYCTGGGEAAGLTFGTGDLAWTEEGKAHFDDCAMLFRLDYTIFWISLGMLVLLLILLSILPKNRMREAISREHPSGSRPMRTRPHFLQNRGPFFWGPMILVGIMAILGILAVIDFNFFFEGFHHVFFPGKTNWDFDCTVDEIVNILPETLFQNYGIIIVLCVILLSAAFIGIDLAAAKRRRR